MLYNNFREHIYDLENMLEYDTATQQGQMTNWNGNDTTQSSRQITHGNRDQTNTQSQFESQESRVK
jgi:hypothetical protein